ncbi:hypothetical protein N7509_008192 [Penicillium cosmopolitanum]|uniref:Reverse transcriptase domain-containing protein n=1 Tax=Penicillium cosmopolitanum TaxID=1131564 RepID=A0A9W9VM40_9EURO|nr:uncharacterized protein N7509_008192 [Penicillium cosmopolitanum]KAJ5385651.1 hypothetical protein N7509_008192 [Penicillium cosmopolitanum]
MVRHSSEAPSTTPGGQTTLGSSFYPPEYIWNSLSDTQRDSFMSTVSASLVAGDGQRKRPRIDLTTEEDVDDGRVPSLVVPVLPRFPGLDRAAIIAVFEHTFCPKKDLIKLRSPEFKATAPDGESFDLKSTSPPQGIFNQGLGGMVLFYRRICDLARAYKWQECILQMALDHHQMVVDKGDLTVSLGDWGIGKALESSYLRPDNVLPAKTAPTTPSTRSTLLLAATGEHVTDHAAVCLDIFQMLSPPTSWPAPRPNTSLQFKIFDSSLPPLRGSASPFISSAWETLLEHYPGDLGTICSGILTFGCRLGCTGQPTDRRTSNHHIEEPSIFTQKLSDDLSNRRVQVCTGPVVVSPLGLVPKHDGGWRRIHDLSYPPGRSVNESIPDTASAIQYISIDHIFDLIRTSGRGCCIIKRDIKDAFRNIPVAPADRPLLAFWWDSKIYMECCLPFGLATAPFIFNLFAEGLNWLLTAYLPVASIVHYLDDFITVFLLLNNAKDAAGTVISVLGVEIDTTLLQARMPHDKLTRASSEAASLLRQNRVSHKALQRVTPPPVALQRPRIFPPHQHSLRRLSHDSHEDFAWWTDTIPFFNGIYFVEKSRPLVALYTDACDSGLGLFFFYAPSRDSAGDWLSAAPYLPSTHAAIVDASSARASEAHINTKEVTAILQAFLLHSLHWAHHRVLAFTDCAVAFHGLSKQALRGPAHRQLLMLFSIAAALDIEIQPRWLPSSENMLADALSLDELLSLAPPAWFSRQPIFVSVGHAKLVWNGLAEGTRKGYRSAQRSYTRSCALNGVQPWPATAPAIYTWLTERLPGAGRSPPVKPDTAMSELSALRAYHVDNGLPEWF